MTIIMPMGEPCIGERPVCGRHLRALRAAGAIAMALAASSTAMPGAQAAVVTWTADKGLWTTKESWSSGELPGATDTAEIKDATSVTHDKAAGDTVVKGVQLKNGADLHLKRGSFKATDGIVGTGKVSIVNIGGATLKETKVSKVTEVAITKLGGAVLDKITFEKIGQLIPKNGTSVTVRNGLTFKDVAEHGALAGNFLFEGAQKVSGAKFAVAGASELSLAKGAALTLDQADFLVGPGQTLVIGSQHAGKDATSLVLTGAGTRFGPVDSTSNEPDNTLIQANRITNKAFITLRTGRTSSTTIKADVLLNEQDILANNSRLTIEAGTFTSNGNGKLTLFSNDTSIKTTQLTNHGEFRVGVGTTVVEGLGGKGAAVVNTGEVKVFDNGTLDLRTGYRQTKGTTTVDGVLTVSEGGKKADAVIDGGKVEGKGTINGNLVSKGKVNPGKSPGVLSVLGDYTQEDGGFLVAELAGTAFGPDGVAYDRLVVDGTTSLAGVLTVALLEGFTPSAEDRFTILTSTGSLIGAFANTFAQDDVGRVRAGAGVFSVLYERGSGLSSVVLADYRMTPLPAPAALVAAGLATLAWLRRRKVA